MGAYGVFGDVIFLYHTYRINCYDMPLEIWVELDNLGNSIFFGCVVFYCEMRRCVISSFTWAIKVHF